MSVRPPASTSKTTFLAERARVLLGYAVGIVIVAGVVTLGLDAIQVGWEPTHALLRVAEFGGAAVLLAVARSTPTRWGSWFTAVAVWWTTLDAFTNVRVSDPVPAATLASLIVVGTGLFPASLGLGLLRSGLAAGGVVIGLTLAGVSEPAAYMLPIACAAVGVVMAAAQNALFQASWTVHQDALEASAAAEQAATARARFLRSVSHEMRTPLHGLLGLLDQARAHARSSQQAETLDLASQMALVLDTLMEDALSQATLDGGRLRVREEPTHVLRAIRAALYAVPCQASLEVRHTPPGPVQTDPRRVQQVVQALLMRCASAAVGTAAHVIVDWADDKLDLIVEVPWEGGETAAQGLRLGLVRRVVDALGGELIGEVEGRTSRMLARLPAVPVALHQDIDLRVSGRVLVVDDNALNRTILVRMVERIGAAVDEAEDGADALRHLEAASYDLVLMDLDMPVLDGLEATRIARARGFTGPILAVTASSGPETARAVAEAGMDALITKPARPADILPAVIAALEPERSAVETEDAGTAA